MPGAEKAPVPLVNVIPLRIRSAPSLSATAQAIQGHINEMQDFEGVPLGKIQHLSHSGGSQLFDMLFSTQFEDDREDRLWDLLDASPDLPPDVSDVMPWRFRLLKDLVCVGMRDHSATRRG